MPGTEVSHPGSTPRAGTTPASPTSRTRTATAGCYRNGVTAMCDVLWKLRDVDYARRSRSTQEEVGTDPFSVSLLLFGSIALIVSPGRLWSQIADKAADADSKADKRVLQRHDCSRTEEAQCRQRPHAHDPAHLWRDLPAGRPLDE